MMYMYFREIDADTERVTGKNKGIHHQVSLWTDIGASENLACLTVESFSCPLDPVPALTDHQVPSAA